MRINYKNAVIEFRSDIDTIPGVRYITVIFDDNLKYSGIQIDTRDNTIQIVTNYLISSDQYAIVNDILNNFNLFKKTEVGYGDPDSWIKYQPTKNIKVVDFLNYLKSKNREELIDKLI